MARGHRGTPPDDRIPMTYGRDAADVAMTTSFGSAKLKKFTVITEEITPPREA